MGIYEKKLAEEGITLPDVAPAANYVPMFWSETCFMLRSTAKFEWPDPWKIR